MSHDMSHNYFITVILPAIVTPVAVDVGVDWRSAY